MAAPSTGSRESPRRRLRPGPAPDRRSDPPRPRCRGLSTASRAPALCAIAAAAAISVMAQEGLAGVSIQTSRVRPGRMAAARAARSAHVDEVDLQPARAAEIHQPLPHAPIDLGGCHGVVAGLQRLEGRHRRRHAAGKQHRPCPAFQRRQQRLGLIEGRRPGPDIGPPAASSDPARARRWWRGGSPERRPGSRDRSNPARGRRAWRDRAPDSWGDRPRSSPKAPLSVSHIASLRRGFPAASRPSGPSGRDRSAA